MAGLDPAIHVFLFFVFKTWMPATSSAKTRGACHRAVLCADPLALLRGHDGGKLSLRLERSRQQTFDRIVDRLGAAQDVGDRV